MAQAGERLECDLLVVGGGMAGMSAAGRAAERGKTVVVVEKAADIGGSAALSGGYLWTTPSLQQMGAWDNGSEELHALVSGTFPILTDWMRRRGVHMEKHQPVLFGRGYQFDVLGHFRQCVADVERAGGHVVRDTRVRALRTEAGRVVGASIDHADGQVEVDAGRVLLATGGFQGSPDKRAELIHPAARDIPLRSNPNSVGDGLRLALAAGAANAGPNAGFYGHLLCSPVTLKSPTDFISYAQFHSDQSVLLNRAGLRYVDESRADHENTQATLRQPGATALLVWDERVQREAAVQPVAKGHVPVDRFAVAQAAGAKGTTLNTLEELAGFAASLGFDGDRCVRTLREFNDTVQLAPEGMSPARERFAVPLREPPFRALLVVPAITFSYAGVSIDTRTRALDPAGAPVPGLHVAGADAGNVYRSGYCGGLALAGTLGFTAGDLGE